VCFHRTKPGKNIQDDIKSLGNNTIYIDKWDYSGGPNSEWWKFVNRPTPKLEEMKLIKEKTPAAARCILHGK
jgi:putative ABC transport system permease protein